MHPKNGEFNANTFEMGHNGTQVMDRQLIHFPRKKSENYRENSRTQCHHNPILIDIIHHNFSSLCKTNVKRVR